jgi:flavin reductase (DIM6/NTAB) family NADH-FMN oxidoreductase RutF
MDPALARALAEITTGIYVLTVAEGDLHHGMSSSWVTQASGDPLRIVAAVDNHHFTCPILERTGRFGLNVVGAAGKKLEDYFFSSRSRRPDNLIAIAYSLSPKLKVPWLDLSPISIEAGVTDTKVVGDHTLFIAEPAGARVNSEDPPITSRDLDYVYLGGSTVFRRKR